MSMVATLDWFNWISYGLSFFVLLFSVVYIRAFWPYLCFADTMVRALARAVIVSCFLFGAFTAFWDIGLRSWQLHHYGFFKCWAVVIGPVYIDRMDYMVFHFLGFAYVAICFGRFFQATIDENARKDWPWFMAPFYPKRRIFW